MAKYNNFGLLFDNDVNEIFRETKPQQKIQDGGRFTL
jgi:hypothetical protein